MSSERSVADLQAMTRLQEVGALCARAGKTLNECLDAVLDAAIAVTGADKGNIQLVDESGALTIAAQSGFDESFLNYFASVGPEDHAACGAAMQSGTRVIVEDVTQSKIFTGQPSLQVLLEAEVHAVQSTPLVCRDGRLLGMLNNHFGHVHRPSELELRYLDLLARMAADVIERRQAHERLQESEKQVRRARDYAEATLRTSPIPLLILRSDLRVVSGNEAFYEVFEIEPEEAKGRSVYELANGEWNIPRLRELLEDILPHEHWFHGFEITHTFEKIGERTLLLNARRMEVEAGALERIVLAIDDVTDRKRVESERERLLKTEQDLRHVSEEANRLKDEFLAIMSHELRNPLNWILGYSELLLRTEETSRSPELLRTSEAIKRNALIQARLIRDLLDLSRLRSGKISLNNETVSLLVAVDHAVETVRAEADAKNIAIEIAVFSEPLFVQGDSVRLEQILWNLFEMFRQGDAGTNRPHSGMGIGLAVVNQLVDLHKGSISAFSAGPAKGATFTLRFPLSVEVKTLPAPALKLVTALDNLSILVVDDSVETTEMLTTLLSIKGAKVIPATSGNEALQVMVEREVDVVLSDISMPGMDGFEFLKRLRQIPGRTDVPVLALTGFGRPEDIERAKAEGFFSHVTKPFEVDALIGVLQKLPKKQR